MRPAVIGKDGRTTAIREALRSSPLVTGDVPYLSDGKRLSDPAAFEALLEKARRSRPDFVFVGPEEPLEKGVVDRLDEEGIPCIGPTQALARLESSKAFTRQLLRDHRIPGNPEHRVFQSLDGMEQYLRQLDGFVIKPDGLTGGKGVRVSGEHLTSLAEGLQYAHELFQATGGLVLVEEKLDGEEFSLQSFCDGTRVAHMPVVQDHKRAFDGDTGPNTGGMGSYSCADHRLPFLDEATVKAACDINEAVAKALSREDAGQKYKGILYGGFMLTRDGLRLIEYNARFGDPESLNVLSLLETDFAQICVAILEERLDPSSIRFRHLATVCKYVVPAGYPDHPVKNERVDMSAVPPDSASLRRFVAALDDRSDGWYLTGSRAVAFVGIGPTLDEAEHIAEAAASAVAGPVYHRKDIGTPDLIQRRIDHVRALSRR